MNAPQLPGEAAALESLGHLKQKICLMWGSNELDIFISRLIMDSRDGQRQGLPVAVAAELLFLSKTNKIIRAIELLSRQNVTLKEAYRIVDEGDQQRLEADTLDNPLISRDTISRGTLENADRRSGLERRHFPRTQDNTDRRSGLERRHSTRTQDDTDFHSNPNRRQSASAEGATASFGQLVFKMIFSKAFIFLIVLAMTIKLLWPYFKGASGS